MGPRTPPNLLFPHECKIERVETTKGRRGAGVETRSTLGSGAAIPCFRQPRSQSRLPETLQHEGRLCTDVFYLGSLTDFPKKGDFLVHEAQTFEVLEAINTGNLNIFWKLICSKME